MMGLLIALQVFLFGANFYNQDKIEDALPKAAAEGKDTFVVPQMADLFKDTGTSLTMVNGWRAVNEPNQCSVNLVYSDTGIPVEDKIGFIFEIHAPARRFVIKDCSKLPERVFRPYIGG